MHGGISAADTHSIEADVKRTASRLGVQERALRDALRATTAALGEYSQGWNEVAAVRADKAQSHARKRMSTRVHIQHLSLQTRTDGTRDCLAQAARRCFSGSSARPAHSRCSCTS